jgi:hypothetical protein
MKDCNYKPSGELQGDTKGLPDRGTGTGWHGADPMLDGRSTDADATNSLGSIGGATKSDSESTPFGGSTRI